MFLTNLDYCHTVQGNIFANHRRSLLFIHITASLVLTFA